MSRQVKSLAMTHGEISVIEGRKSKQGSKNMNGESRCPIWNTPASRESLFDRDVERVDSPRAGGWYSISGQAITLLPQIDDRVKARLTTWLVDQRRLGVQCPEILQQTITDAKQQRDLSVHDRADRLLQYIGDQIGEMKSASILSLSPQKLYPTQQ